MTRTEKFEYGESEGTITKREINGNTYIVALYHETSTRYDDKVILVFADERTGEDHGFVDHPNSITTEYDRIVTHEVGHQDTRPIEKHVSEAVNTAVCIVEDKKQEEQKFEDAIDAAIKANKEVHEGIDYALKNSNRKT